MLRGPLSTKDFAAHSDWIAGAIWTLLGFYYDPEEHQKLVEAMLKQWVLVLEPFSPKCIEAATQRWVQDESRRPTPADIKAMCFRVAAGK